MATAASDNVYPKIIGAEQGANPAAPAAGTRKLFAKADGWYDEDSSGVVTGPLGAGSGGGGSAPVGFVPVAFPVAFSPWLSAAAGSYDTVALRARLHLINIPGTMALRHLALSCASGGAGTYTWGLFDYSSNPAACTKVAGGSGVLSTAGWNNIAAAGGPVTVQQGNYALIVHAPSSGFANIYRPSNPPGGADSFHKYQDGWAWDDTPDISPTGGWIDQGTPLFVGLHGDVAPGVTF